MIGRGISMYGGSYLGHSTSFMYGGFGFVFAGIALLLIIGAVVHFAKKGKHASFQANDEAFESLKLRFVKGEITEEEYTRMKIILGK